MLKRILSAAVALCLLLALAACGNDKKNESSQADPTASQAEAATPAPTATPAPQAKAAQVHAEGGLNIRSKPSTEGEILDLAEDGEKLPLLVDKPSDGWYQVEYRGQSAYISAEYATVVEVTLEEYNRLKAAASATPQPEETPAPTAAPAASTDPENQGVLTPPVDQQQAESASTVEDGE